MRRSTPTTKQSAQDICTQLYKDLFCGNSNRSSGWILTIDYVYRINIYINQKLKTIMNSLLEKPVKINNQTLLQVVVISTKRYVFCSHVYPIYSLINWLFGNYILSESLCPTYNRIIARLLSFFGHTMYPPEHWDFQRAKLPNNQSEVT